ncbi:MAG: GNAT family N-acetyltransferase [Anaerolineae bacterium]
MIIRHAFPEDIALCAELDGTVESDQVWQMDERSVGNELQLVFRQQRLPRPVRVPFPRDLERLPQLVQGEGCFLVASEGAEILGFIYVQVEPAEAVGWVRYLVVARTHRRRGIGTRLVQASADWSRRAGLRRLLLETCTKNYAGLSFCQRLGSTFCGYNDQLYGSLGIAVFFAYPLGFASNCPQ